MPDIKQAAEEEKNKYKYLVLEKENIVSLPKN